MTSYVQLVPGFWTIKVHPYPLQVPIPIFPLNWGEESGSGGALTSENCQILLTAARLVALAPISIAAVEMIRWNSSFRLSGNSYFRNPWKLVWWNTPISTVDIVAMWSLFYVFSFCIYGNLVASVESVVLSRINPSRTRGGVPGRRKKTEVGLTNAETPSQIPFQPRILLQCRSISVMYYAMSTTFIIQLE